MEIGKKLSLVVYILFVFYFENHPISLLIKWFLKGRGDSSSNVAGWIGRMPSDKT